MTPIPGYPNYFATKGGSIYSNTFAGFQWKRGKRELRELKPSTNNKGYYYVSLHNDSGHKKFLVHRLVLLSHLPQPKQKPCACHINGVKTDNRLDNLKWDDVSGNMQDRRRHGTANWGETNGRAKYTAATMVEIDRLIKSGIPYTRVAMIVGVGEETARRIKHRKNWKHLFND